ncbi:toll/interleukin-1 receptor domain-containing protein [Variovorax sp. J22P240]|uniref:toll/interleukin-1 receptor domain-containing protein n=1 Tax=Variovorax sp. J22P240 TaxID=3053514 RepID=UPI0025756C44|nr:toll/interleukin-1 receptor domain-containing protein [Variovorax sp. J22P240]MDM0001789.1 toll/interleukin-1 receptor domain-containing protein [Variovorax sp. J22P240]
MSYSRLDSSQADALAAHLARSGFSVWIDRKEILAGDDFVHALSNELQRSDALVVLLTASSAASSWCHAEIQRALARRIAIILVEDGTKARLPDAIERLLRDVQRVTWTGGAPDLAVQLQRARRRKRLRLATRAAVLCVAVAGLSGLTLLTTSSINDLNTRKQVQRTLAEAAASTSVWSGDETRARMRSLSHEPDLSSGLQALFADITQTAVARSNAWQALDALREGRERERRTFLRGVDWKGARLADTLWAHTTYTDGSIRDLVARRMRVAGVVFGAAPSSSKSGLALSGIRFDDSDLWFLRIDGTQLVDVEFANSKFRGAQLDLSGAAGVRFVSKPASQDFLSSDVSIIEDSWISQGQSVEIEPGVIDLSKPEQEILFDGVVFSRVRFDGHFKPAWFRNSHFNDCVFPVSFPLGAVLKNGNFNANSVVAGN